MLEPFLKWPGGKRWLTSKFPTLFPSSYERYIEPFVGGGAVFFFLEPKRSILSDSNKELVNTYSCIKKYPETIHKHLQRLHRRHCSDLYYRMRKEEPVEPIERAIRFLYLNRTCFNGIYRVNLKGEFNVPMGTKTLIEYPDDYLAAVSRSLRGALLPPAWDFERTINKAKKGDFLFVDPPYTVMHNNNNFVKYNASLFSWPDQVRLATAVRKAARRGALVMISNADHEEVRKLYSGFGTHYSICRSSILSADPGYRRTTTELLVLNYELSSARVKNLGNGKRLLVSVAG